MVLRIDRASFLTLTFGMAGVACNAGASPVVANVVDIPQQPPQPGDAGAPAPIASADAASSSALRARPEAPVAPEDDDDADVGSSTTEGGVMRLLPLSNAQGCGWVDPKTISAPPAACRDDRGAAGTCGVMKTCSGFPFPREKCEAYRKLFKPRVAQTALDCLAKLSDKQTCDACNAYRCGDLALKSACPDASVDAGCVQIVAKCSAVSMSECRTYMAGLNATGRAKMVSCLTGRTGCGFGIYSCAEGLF
jgi:hypothetical protein